MNDEKNARAQKRRKKKRNGVLEHRSYFSPSTSTSRFRVSHVPPSTRNIRACHRDEANVSLVHSIYFTCLFQSRLITFAAISCGRVWTYKRMHICVCVCVFARVFRVYVEIRCTCSCLNLHNTPVFTDSSTYTSPSPLSSLTRCKSAQWKRCRLNRLTSSRFVSHVISSRCHALTSINVECQNPLAYFVYYAIFNQIPILISFSLFWDTFLHFQQIILQIINLLFKVFRITVRNYLIRNA